MVQILNRQPFLLVLDKLERALAACARFDAADLSDDNLDEQTANRVGGPSDCVGPHRLRKTADPRAGAFLKRLARGLPCWVPKVPSNSLAQTSGVRPGIATGGTGMLMSQESFSGIVSSLEFKACSHETFLPE